MLPEHARHSHEQLGTNEIILGCVHPHENAPSWGGVKVIWAKRILDGVGAAPSQLGICSAPQAPSKRALDHTNQAAVIAKLFNTQSKPSRVPRDDADLQTELPAMPRNDADLQTEPSAMPCDDADLQTELPPMPREDADLPTELPPMPRDDADLQTEPPAMPCDDADLQTEPPAMPRDDADLQTELPPMPRDDADLQTELPAMPRDDADLQTEPPAMPHDDADLQTELPPMPRVDADLQTELPPMPRDDADLQTEPPPMPRDDADLQTELPPMPRPEAVPCSSCSPPPQTTADLQTEDAEAPESAPSPAVLEHIPPALAHHLMQSGLANEFAAFLQVKRFVPGAAVKQETGTHGAKREIKEEGRQERQATGQLVHDVMEISSEEEQPMPPDKRRRRAGERVPTATAEGSDADDVQAHQPKPPDQRRCAGEPGPTATDEGDDGGDVEEEQHKPLGKRRRTTASHEDDDDHHAEHHPSCTGELVPTTTDEGDDADDDEQPKPPDQPSRTGELVPTTTDEGDDGDDDAEHEQPKPPDQPSRTGELVPTTTDEGDDSDDVACMMLQEHQFDSLRQRYRTGVEVDFKLLQVYNLKVVPMEFHVMIRTDHASQTILVGRLKVTKIEQLRLCKDLSCLQGSLHTRSELEQWQTRLTNDKVVWAWTFSVMELIDSPTCVRLTSPKFRNRHFVCKRGILRAGLVASPPTKASLVHTAEFFIQLLPPSERKLLEATANALNGRHVRVGSACSGSDICIVAMRALLRALNVTFSATVAAHDCVYIYICLVHMCF